MSRNEAKVNTHRFFVAKNPEFSACPSCGEKGVLKRSRPRSSWERFVKSVTPFGYYRCKKCGWRGTLLTVRLTRDFKRNLWFYFFLALVTAYVVKFVITRFIMK